MMNKAAARAATLETWLGRQRSERTRGAYRRIVEQFFNFYTADDQEIKEQVRRWRERLEEEQYAGSTIRTYLATLRSFFQAAHDSGLINSEQFEAIWQPGLIPGERPYASGRWLTEEEEQRLLGAIDRETKWGRRDYALIRLALRSRMRLSKILTLDEKRGAVFAPLTEAAGRVRRLYGREWRTHSLSAANIGRLVKMYASWAGLPADEITPKTLRYTAARRRWEQGWTLKELTEFLGYTDVETTRRLVKNWKR